MIYVVGILCGFAFIAKDCYMLLFQNYQFNLVTRWRNELSEKFMRMYLGLNYRYHLRQASSAIINTLTSTVSASINGFLLQMLFIVSYSIVGLCLLGYMLLNYLLVTVVTFGVLIAIILFQIKLLKKASQKINEETVKNKEENLINLKQGIEAIKETKMFLRENFYQQLFLKSNRRVTDTERRS
ncbi:TPA: ABC transporter transmembrane domain-containing protein, partial [Yersinia enterocolitica]